MNRPVSLRLLLALFTLVCLGCGSEPKLSQQGYQQAMALFNACSRKDQTAIEKVATAISTARTQSQISDSEADLLLGVLETARQGNWDSASARMRKLMEGQASRASQDPSEGPRKRHQH